MLRRNLFIGMALEHFLNQEWSLPIALVPIVLARL